VPDVGDVRTETLTVDGDMTTTVTLAAFKPDGTTVTPAPTTATADDGATWTAEVEYDVAGWWLLTWAIGGTGEGVEHGRVFVEVPPESGGSPAYASPEDLISYLRLHGDDTYDDQVLADVLDEVSREIDSHCSRRFWRDDVATERTFDGGYCGLPVNDFWTTDDLVVEGAAWPMSGATLLPRNGVVDGIEGWPYTSIQRTYRWNSEVAITARWGWERIPGPVHQSCLILAAATVKLREQPGGPGGFGEWGGIVRARDNPHTTIKLQPYRLDPAVVA
jgi:hypothetical protein